jgi:hypothetical protein
MARPKLRTNVYMGGRFGADLATKFFTLARNNGVSIREALRRLMVQAILTGQIPGLEAFGLEQREHEKWGSATPVYDGEAQAKPKGAGKQAPASPSQ